MLTEYQKAPAVTRQRIYLETMTEVLPKLGRKFITDQHAQPIHPFMQLQTEKANP